jgi:hypothetical protein
MNRIRVRESRTVASYEAGIDCELISKEETKRYNFAFLI